LIDFSIDFSNRAKGLRMSRMSEFNSKFGGGARQLRCQGFDTFLHTLIIYATYFTPSIKLPQAHETSLLERSTHNLRSKFFYCSISVQVAAVLVSQPDFVLVGVQRRNYPKEVYAEELAQASVSQGAHTLGLVRMRLATSYIRV